MGERGCARIPEDMEWSLTMKGAVLATMAIIAVGSASHVAAAADLPPRMPTKAPPMAYEQPFSWTGCYIGINGIGEFGQARFQRAGMANQNFNVNGGFAGLTAGYNYQIGPAVVGFETDIDGGQAKGTGLCAAGVTCQVKQNFLGTVRGRLGYAYDRFMPFVTGGLAYGDVRVNALGLNAMNTTRVGWTVGGGVEAQIYGNWTAKLEYDFVSLGNVNCGVNCGVPAGAAPLKVRLNENVIRGGVNYRF
jgi:outer membrane immunogenic protein